MPLLLTLLALFGDLSDLRPSTPDRAPRPVEPEVPEGLLLGEGEAWLHRLAYQPWNHLEDEGPGDAMMDVWNEPLDR